MASETNNDDGMGCMHGIKVICMFLIMLGHRMMFSMSAPIGNPSFIEEGYKKVEFSFFHNSPIVVDTFFAISGFLATYLVLHEIDKTKKMLNPFVLYLHRIIRLTPAYAIVLGFYCTIMVQMGEGPFWNDRVTIEHERCLQSWWTNLLYINNYVLVDKMCMFQSWYLTCDTHYFLIIPFLAYLLYKKPRIGLVCLCLIITASVIVPFIVIYLKKEDPFLLLYMKTLRDPIANKTFQEIYIPSHMRAAPYFNGVLLGFIKFKLQKTGFKIPSIIRYPTWVIGWIVIICVLISGYTFYIPTDEKNYFFSALYGTMHHFLWSALMSLGIVFISEGYGNWLAPYLNWRPWALLSRITYTAFLTHGAVQMYTAGIQRTPAYAGIWNLLKYSASDIVFAYVIGFALSLVFESPIMEIEKMLFRRKPSKKTEEKKNIQQDKSTKKDVYVDIFIPKISPVCKNPNENVSDNNGMNIRF